MTTVAWSAEDCIVAPATAAGAGARGIVRLAGNGLERVLATLLAVEPPGRWVVSGERPRVVAARLAGDLATEWGPLPVAVLHWPGPGGPIGGPLAEVQVPASSPLVAAIVAAACRRGARLARGGEFTLRAFLAGRLDLEQAEAVLGVVEAQSPQELATALDRMAGGAGATLKDLRSRLLDLLADLEAALDFADETTPDAVPVADAAARRAIEARLARLDAELAAAADGVARRDAAHHADLPRVVLVGRPNIGKSSLFNALVGRSAALVADEAGTTRDWLEAPLVAEGAATCIVVDIAGMAGESAAGPDSLAAEAARSAGEQILRADVVVACRDAAAADDEGIALRAGPRIDVVTRCDRPVTVEVGPAIRTSVVDGRGIADLRAAIRRTVAALPPRGSPATIRLAAGIAEAAVGLAAAAADLGSGGDEAVAAGHLRRAVAALDEVTGAVIGTDLLDRIFSRHCVGK